MEFAAVIPEWIQAAAALASVVLAAIAVSLARMSLRHSHEATRVAAKAAGLERQKVLGSAIGLLSIDGFTNGDGEDGVLVQVADFMQPSRRPQLLEARLESAAGEVVGKVKLPFLSVEKESDRLRAASSLVVPTESSGGIGVFFALSPAEQRELRDAGNQQGLSENAVMLPVGTVLRMTIRDPLGQEAFSFPIDQCGFTLKRE